MTHATLRRRLRLLVALPVAAALFSSMATAPASADEVVINTDFSSNLSPFTNNAKTPNTIAAVPSSDDPSNNVALLHSENTNNISLYRYGAWGGELTLKASMRFSDTTHRREAFLSNATIDDATRYSTIFTFQTDGTIKLLDTVSTRTYEADQWYDLEAVVDHNDGLVDAWINGDQVIENQPMNSAGLWGQSNSIRFTQNGSADTTTEVEIDNVVAVVRTGRDLTGEVGGWGLRAHSADEPQFTAQGDALQIAAETGEAGSFVKSIAVTPGRTYALERKVDVTGAMSGFKARLIATAYADGRPLDPTQPGTLVQSETLVSNTIDRDLFLPLRAPEGADEIRFELYTEGPGTARFGPGEPEEYPSWQEVISDYPSSRIEHPVAEPKFMFGTGSSYNTLANETDTERIAAIAPLMALSEADLAATTREINSSRASLHAHPDIEKHVRRMADLYASTGDEQYADAAITVLTAMAATYDDVPYLHGGFKSWETVISPNVVYAYDMIYNAEWEMAERDAVENMLRKLAVDAWTMNRGTINNITPYGLKPGIGIAAVLGDPKLLRLFLPIAETLVSGEWWHSDGLWEEATLSYQGQVLSNLEQLYGFVEANVVDPEGYTDDVLGLELDHTNLMTRYPIFEKGRALLDIAKQPNGHIIPLNDTWAGPSNLSEYDHTSPVLDERLHDVALNGYGFYALTHGDASAGPYGEATQITLEAPQIARGGPHSGGHSHGNQLGMSLWGSGTEALPYVGYPARTPIYRYFQTSVVSQNAPWVWDSAAEPYSEQAEQPTHASITGIDTGVGSDEQISFVEASLPGPDGDNVASKRRMVMVVALENGRSYALDVSRLQGGEAHQIFMRSSEQEDTTWSSDLSVEENAGEALKDVLVSRGKSYGLDDFRELMESPRIADGSNGFSFTWTGATSGTSMRAFMNGVEGDDVIFSTIPTNRRTQLNADLKDAFPGEHFQRLTKVDPEDVTVYGSVYETWRDGQDPMVTSVEWLPVPDEDPNTAIAKIVGEDFTDYVYISDDDTPRSIDGIVFTGETAHVRVDTSVSDTPVAGGECGMGVRIYTYADSGVRCGESGTLHTADVAPIEGMVTATESRNDGSATGGTGTENVITVDAELANPEALVGQWLTVQAADGSGWAFEIESVEGMNVHVTGWLPFAKDEDGFRRTFAPFEGTRIDGPVTFSLDVGETWQKATPTPTPTPEPTPTPTPTPEPTPTPTEEPDLYNTPGLHDVNGRKWFTSCEPYSQTVRCRTMIWATTVTQVNGEFRQNNGWVFNNLTYLPRMKRAQWSNNPLGYTGSWTGTDGRQWRTECDTALSGRGGCRSFIMASVIESTPRPGGGYTYQWVTKEIFNNMVRFKKN